ncbi:MAG: 50S ribosomal protein L29 [Candidatus Dojkabacteria bacterium]|nr:50S ribosomal protein L29 [Candidatus Dojkabacteria bacterium]MDQ7021382.1 50S ribosomal protein L29 [Candidatus Dojkabacteria bacterium]
MAETNKKTNTKTNKKVVEKVKATEVKEVKAAKKVAKVKDISSMKLEDLKVELQRTKLKLVVGEESNTSKVTKLKREIARKLTKLNLEK